MNSSFGKLIVRSLAFIGGGLLLLGIVLVMLAKAGAIADGPVVLMSLILGSAITIAALVMLTMQDRENARRFASAAAAAADIAEGRPAGFEADDELKTSLRSIGNYLSERRPSRPLPATPSGRLLARRPGRPATPSPPSRRDFRPTTRTTKRSLSSSVRCSAFPPTFPASLPATSRSVPKRGLRRWRK